MLIDIPTDFGSDLKELEAEVQAFVKPWGDLLDEIGFLCDASALDGFEIDSGKFDEGDLGRSDLAHTILRMIAKTIRDVEEA